VPDRRAEEWRGTEGTWCTASLRGDVLRFDVLCIQLAGVRKDFLTMTREFVANPVVMLHGSPSLQQCTAGTAYGPTPFGVSVAQLGERQPALDTVSAVHLSTAAAISRLLEKPERGTTSHALFPFIYRDPVHCAALRRLVLTAAY